ncbi:MAG: FHA domain-containing protein, partial [Planctomycetota bacterium]
MSEVFENPPVPEMNPEEPLAPILPENKPTDLSIHVLIEGEGERREFSLIPHTFILVGRTPKAGTPEEAIHFFPINEMDISRKHAELFWDGQTLYLKVLSDSGIEHAGETLYPPETRPIAPQGTLNLFAREKKRTFSLQYQVPELLAPKTSLEEDDKTRVYTAPAEDDKTRVYQPSEDVTKFDLSSSAKPTTERSMTLHLKIMNGNCQGIEKAFTFTRSGEEGRIYLGRSEETEFPVAETWVSRIHASISREEQGFFLRRETQYDQSVFIDGQSLLLKQEVPLKQSGLFNFKAGEQQADIQYISDDVVSVNPKKTDSNVAEKEAPKIKMTEFAIESSIAGTEPIKIDVSSHKLSYFLGTSPSCDYRIIHQKEFVAPQHIEITFDTASRSYFIRCVADRSIGMQLNDKSIYEQTPLQDGDRIRFGLDSKAPEVFFRSTAPTLLSQEEASGEPVFYGLIELRWEDEEKTKEIRLHGVVRSSPSRTGVRVLIGN